MAGFIPDNVLDQVRHANDIVDIIGSYFPLKRRGANFIALCPFHKEKTPSFNVSPTRQIWHCFGCGAGGDVFKFVMQYENLPFIDTVRKLAERGGVTLAIEENAGGPTRDEKELLYKLHDQVTTFFHQHLLQQPADAPVRAYLQKRRITAETVKRWRLGYAPDAWDALLQWAGPKKFSTAILEAAGLILKRDGGGYYDRFRGRLMFPISDEQGRVVAFSGRILTEAKDQPKYVNSPETTIFQKGKILFALDKAKRSILDDKQVVVCEGQLDTITCHEAGFTNVVAPQGTAFTEMHARILKRYTDEAVLMFDGDDAGQNAAVRNAESLWELGFVIRVALLPDEHDPDSFLKEEGVDKLRTLLANAPSFFDFLLQRVRAQFDAKTERGKLQIADQMVPWLCRIRDPILQATFTQRTAAQLGVREEVVRQRMTDLMRHKQKSRATEPQEANASDEFVRPVGLPSETALLQVMLTDERVVESVGERLDRSWLTDSVAGELIRRTLDLHLHGQWNGANSLLNDSDELESRLLSELLTTPAPNAAGADVVTDYLEHLHRRWLKFESEELQQRLRQTDPFSDEAKVLQKRALDLRRQLDNIRPLLNSVVKPRPY